MTNSSKKQLKASTSGQQQLQSRNSDGLETENNSQMGIYSEYAKSIEHLRCRIDVMDMSSQPDGEFKYILIYEDDATKFTFLKPLQGIDPITIASSIIDIFCQLGSTLIISTTCPEFGHAVTTEIRKQWPGCFIVLGRRPSENELMVFEKCRDRVKKALAEWRDEKRMDRWSMGVRFVQWGLNTQGNMNNDGSRDQTIMHERALLGVSSMLHCNIVAEVKTEEDLINALIAQEN